MVSNKPKSAASKSNRIGNYVGNLMPQCRGQKWSLEMAKKPIKTFNVDIKQCVTGLPILLRKTFAKLDWRNVLTGTKYQSSFDGFGLSLNIHRGE